MSSMRPAVQYRPMTTDECTMARALAEVTMVPGIPSKRFAREMAAESRSAVSQISARQAEVLRSLVYRYRRQIPKAIVALATDTVQHS